MKNVKLIFKTEWMAFLFIFSLLMAQNSWQPFYDYYQNGQYWQLKNALQQLTPNQQKTLEYLFFSSLFIKDAEQAVKNYQKVYDRAQGKLKSLAAKKLNEFYYARGFYFKAKEFVSDMQKNEKITEQAPISSKAPGYYIQLGAFSSRANALKRQNEIAQRGVQSRIVIKKINDRNFYCVWVKGSNTFADTERIAKQIKQHLNIEYRIIKE